MWSGPRNISTATMRSFGNRTDTAVADEPFYAAWLVITGADHPMRDAILAAGESDWRKIAARLEGPPPESKRIFYQKHMTHHMVPEIGRNWMRACRHAFLIRHPARVIASYAAKRGKVTFADLGFTEQTALFDEACAIEGAPPPVVDAETLLAEPRASLSALCNALGLPFDERMLTWPPGRRSSDGIWAAHWYDAVERSTGFGMAEPPPELTDPKLEALEAEAMPHYERLAAFALKPLGAAEGNSGARTR